MNSKRKRSSISCILCHQTTRTHQGSRRKVGQLRKRERHQLTSRVLKEGRSATILRGTGGRHVTESLSGVPRERRAGRRGRASACPPLRGGRVRRQQARQGDGRGQESRVDQSSYLVLRRGQRRGLGSCGGLGILRRRTQRTQAERHHQGLAEGRRHNKSARYPREGRFGQRGQQRCDVLRRPPGVHGIGRSANGQGVADGTKESST